MKRNTHGNFDVVDNNNAAVLQSSNTLANFRSKLFLTA